MEFARRPVFAALIALGTVVVSAAAVALRARPEPPQAPAEQAHPPIPSPSHRILVEVLNQTSRPGLARTATRMLRRQGLDVVFFGNGEGDAHLDSTRVIARRGDRAAADRVAGALGCGVVRANIDTLRRVDVSVLLGDDYHPPADGHP